MHYTPMSKWIQIPLSHPGVYGWLGTCETEFILIVSLRAAAEINNNTLCTGIGQ